MITPEALIGAVALFVLRVFGNTIGTLGVIFVVRQQRLAASLLAAVEVLVWVVVVSKVINDLSNWINLLAYCGGFAAGNYTGMIMESHLVTSYVKVTITTRQGAAEMASRLRERGFGVTVAQGIGRDGPVTLLHTICTHHTLQLLLGEVQAIDPQVFVSVEDLRAVQQGWIHPNAVEQGGD